MVRSVAKQRVSKHEAALMLQQRGRPILRDALLRTAPQDEAEKEPSMLQKFRDEKNYCRV